MNRQATTLINTPKYSGVCPRPKMDKCVWAAMFSDARIAFSANVEGIVAIKGERAWFQIVGDKTPYSMLLTNAELALFFPN